MNYKSLNKNYNISQELREQYHKWLEYLTFEKKYSDHTIIAYKTDLDYFLSWLNLHFNSDIDLLYLLKININDIRAWLNHRKLQKLSTSSSRRALSTIRNFFKHISKQSNNLNNNAIVNIRSPKKPEVLPKALTEEDTKAALEYIESISLSDWTGIRDKTILLIIYGCGLRISEVLNLTKNNINDKYLNIYGKGKKERIVPLLDVVNFAIKQYLAICPYNFKEDDKIFIGKQGKPLNPAVFQRQIRRVRIDLALNDKTTPHAFRHSFASDILSHGADLRSIQELLGHESLSTTQIYTKIEHKRLFEAYNLAHPRAKK